MHHWTTLKLSSENALDLDEAKILSSGVGFSDLWDTIWKNYAQKLWAMYVN